MASIALVNKLSFRSNDSTVNTVFNGQIKLDNGDLIQDHVSNLVTRVMNNEPLPDNIGGKDLKFGFDETDIIDTFSKSSFYIPVEPLVKLGRDFLTPLIDQIMNGNSSAKLAIERLNVDINDYNSLRVDAAVSLIGIPNTIRVNIPFIGSAVFLDDRMLCMPKLDVHLVGGKLSTTVFIPFVSDKINGQKLVDLVRNIFWHENSGPNYAVSLQRMVFGASESSAFRTAAKVSIMLPVGQCLEIVKNYFDEKRPV